MSYNALEGWLCELFPDVVNAMPRPAAVRPGCPTRWRTVFDVGTWIVRLTAASLPMAFAIRKVVRVMTDYENTYEPR